MSQSASGTNSNLSVPFVAPAWLEPDAHIASPAPGESATGTQDGFTHSGSSPYFQASLPAVSPSFLHLLGPSPLHELILSEFNGALYPKPATLPPGEVANQLFDFTQKNNISKTWLYDMIMNGTGLGRTESLHSVFYNPAMEDILDHPERYTSVHGINKSMSDRQGELVKDLSLWKKIQYGPRMTRFSDALESQQVFFDALAKLYADLVGITMGQALVRLCSYFFRPDRLDTATLQTFEAFMAKLKTLAGR